MAIINGVDYDALNELVAGALQTGLMQIETREITLPKTHDSDPQKYVIRKTLKVSTYGVLHPLVWYDSPPYSR